MKDDEGKDAAEFSAEGNAHSEPEEIRPLMSHVWLRTA